jgi:hypothetical protein
LIRAADSLMSVARFQTCFAGASCCCARAMVLLASLAGSFALRTMGVRSASRAAEGCSAARRAAAARRRDAHTARRSRVRFSLPAHDRRRAKIYRPRPLRGDDSGPPARRLIPACRVERVSFFRSDDLGA